MTGMLMAPDGAAITRAYQSVDQPDAATPAASGDFSALISRALDGAIATGHQADQASMQALTGHGDLTQVVTAVSRAELALQTTVAIRDRVLSAYQDIIKMPI